MAVERPTSQPAPRAELVHRLASRHGFSMVGIAPARAVDHAESFEKWLADGKHGDMDYLAEHAPQRLDPRVLVPGAQSIIVVADRYHATLDRDFEDDSLGYFARYAWGDDYHRVLKKRLHDLADSLREVWPNETYLTTVDTAPIMERQHASRAGLGWIGKNTLLLNRHLGSYFSLGEIVTTLMLKPSVDPGVMPTDHCGTCTRCIDACPTQCITPYSVDASRCVSYLTIEHREVIDSKLQQQMGQWIAGCDVCQQVCPYNQARAPEPAPHPAYAPHDLAPALPLTTLLEMDAATREQTFVRSALKRIKLPQLRRNAVIAAGNYCRDYGSDELHAQIKSIAYSESEDALVRQTATQVLIWLDEASA